MVLRTFVFLVLFCGGVSALADTLKSKPPENQVAIVAASDEQRALDDLKDEESKALVEQKELLDESKVLIKQAKKAKSVAEKEFAKELEVLSAYRLKINTLKVERIKKLKASIENMKAQSAQLEKYKSQKKYSYTDLEMVTVVWRKIVDDTINHLLANIKLDIPEIPQLNSRYEGEDKYKTLLQKRSELRKEIDQDIGDFKKSFKALLKVENEIQSLVLLASGRVRANIMTQLIARGEFSVWTIEPRVLRDYVREVKIVPYKFVAILAQKYFEFKNLSQEGHKGWVSMFKQLVLLLIALTSPFFLLKLFRSISTYLEEVRKSIFTSSQLNYKNRTSIAVWIGRVNPYLPWVFAAITVQMVEALLVGTILAPLAIVLPYFNIYVFYRIFKILFRSLLTRVLLSKNLDKIKNSQPRVRSTSARLSILLFAQLAVLHATQDAVRQALIYNLVFDIVSLLNLGMVILESKKWTQEILLMASGWLPEKVYTILEKTLKQFSFSVVLLPLLFLGNVFFLLVTWLYQWLSQFEFGKRLSSELFKRRLEDANEGKDIVHDTLTEQYRSIFADSQEVTADLRVSLTRSPYQICVETVEKWLDNSSYEDLLLLFGNYGIGKSTLLKSLEKCFASRVQTVWFTLEQKVTSEEGLYQILSEALGHTILNIEDLEKLDSSREKTLVFIDDIHNLYLNRMDGLAAYRALIEIASLQLDNIFWCFTCNQRALSHLNGIFGKNHFLGEKIELLSWTDSEIQELIMKRHKTSSKGLKFDQVISAVHRGDVFEASSGLEVQFFRLLWGQSRGNPSTAQELWLSAASQIGRDRIKITVPEFTNPKTLSELADESLLVFSAIAKHENLSLPEMEVVCDLDKSVIKQALKFGEDGLIIQKYKKGRWRLHPKSQYVVQAQLTGRNFIYG